jgi:hypothetical protein
LIAGCNEKPKPKEFFFENFQKRKISGKKDFFLKGIKKWSRMNQNQRIVQFLRFLAE